MTSVTREHMFGSMLAADLERTMAIGTTARVAPWLMVLFALVGIADAFYDSFAILHSQRLWCPPPFNGCNIVAMSPYARVLGIPLGHLGVVYFAFMLMLSALLAYDPLSRGLRLGTVLYAAAGVLASLVLVYIEFTYIHAFSIYDLMSALLTVLLFITAASHSGAARISG